MPDRALKRNNKILYFELLKTVAAFLTVFYHFAYYRLDFGFVEGTQYFPNINRIIMCFSSCCVPVFFMVNGALMLGKERNWKSVYIKAAKLIVLTAFWSLIGFPDWFFKTLIILYLLFPLFQYFYRKKHSLFVLTCVLIFLMPFVFNLLVLILKSASCEWTFSLLGITIGVDSLNPTGIFTMYSILYFLLGPALAKSQKLPNYSGILLILTGWLMVVVECSAYTNLNMAMYDGVNAAFPTVGALLLSTGIFITAKNIPLNSIEKPLSFIGSGILPIYLLHMLMIRLLNLILPSSLNTILSIIITALICIICTVVGKAANRIPVICWLFKM